MLKAPERRLSNGTPLSMVDRYLERALDFYTQKKYDSALLDLDEAIKLQKHNGELLATRGYILNEFGYPDEALLDLEKALKIDPRQWLANYTYGMIAFQKGDYDIAIGHFQRAAQIAPERPEIQIYLAAIYFYKDEKDHAQQAIDRAIELLHDDNKRLKQARSWASTIKKMKK